jgi:hypothetical protein
LDYASRLSPALSAGVIGCGKIGSASWPQAFPFLDPVRRIKRIKATALGVAVASLPDSLKGSPTPSMSQICPGVPVSNQGRSLGSTGSDTAE